MDDKVSSCIFAVGQPTENNILSLEYIRFKHIQWKEKKPR